MEILISFINDLTYYSPGVGNNIFRNVTSDFTTHISAVVSL